MKQKYTIRVATVLLSITAALAQEILPNREALDIRSGPASYSEKKAASSGIKNKPTLEGVYIEWGTKGLFGPPIPTVKIILKADGSFTYKNNLVEESGSGSYLRSGGFVELTFATAHRETDYAKGVKIGQIWAVKLAKDEKGRTVLKFGGSEMVKQ